VSATKIASFSITNATIDTPTRITGVAINASKPTTMTAWPRS